MDILLTVIKCMLIGAFASIPVGPIVIFTLQSCLAHGRKAGMACASGAIISDTVYAAISVFALSATTNFINDNSTIIKIIGGAVIVSVGAGMLFNKGTRATNRISNKRIAMSAVKSTLMGFSNPGGLIWILATLAALHIEADGIRKLIITASICAGSLLYWIAFTTIASRGRNKLTVSTMLKINRFSGIAVAIFGLGIIFSCAAAPIEQGEPAARVNPDRQTKFTRYVNPFCGTDKHGHTFPGATVPFGMVQLSPDTRMDGWDGCSGYHYSDSIIIGFSHTHLSGTGCLDYGDILLMPVTEYDADSLNRALYCSTFSHEEEFASPGYYQVNLQRDSIKAELTAGQRFGMHRYTYPQGRRRQVVMDLEHRDILLGASLKQKGSNTISGMRSSRSWANDQCVYFRAECSEPVLSYTKLGENGALLDFGEGNRPIIIKVGISATSERNAGKNLKAEITDFNFEKARSRAEDLWEEFLSKIDLSGSGAWKSTDKADQERLGTFYTSMYHCAIAPNIMSDVNAPARYTVFSLWDTFRALHPLLNMIERERSQDFLKSFLTIYNELGKLPVWELWGNETNCMIGYNSAPVIADALSKGLLEDTKLLGKLTDALIVSSRKEEFGLDVYRRSGLVLGEEEHESVSKTLEYAFDDWCVAKCCLEMYRRSGKKQYKELSDSYFKSSLYYRNAFDPQTGFMRPRINGIWLAPFEAREVNNHFTEANSWQYSFFVPHDIAAHIDMLGGDSAYGKRLDSLFTAPTRTKGRSQSDITGLIGQYAHGNEPSHHVAYLYNYCGQPWKTQERVREIMETLYSAAPDGECGNDDCGQMAAWYVLSAIGLYNVAPGTDYMDLGAPLFDNISICGGKAVICSDGKGPYVCGAEMNGEPWDKLYIPVNKLLEDGFRFTFHTSEKPSDFGSEARPRTEVTQAQLTANPWFETEMQVFIDSAKVAIGSYDKAFYRIDSGNWNEYTEPFTVTESCLMEAYAINDAGERSFITSCNLTRKPCDKTIELHCEYNPQYDGGSYDALIDGVRGSWKWRAGKWQGFQGQDFEAVVDLLSCKDISTLGAGFCQDVTSWLWMPEYVEFYGSRDELEWTYLGRADNKVDPTDRTIQTQDLCITAPTGIRERYIKVFAKNYGTIPSWHLGAGGEAFIFIDEILVNTAVE